jgi:uncharacterized protein (DUF1697 family)
MQKYIALLRGVNVGGKNRVVMKELKTCFEDYGFVQVKTYLNSGNVIFSSDELDTMVLEKVCETLIKELTGLTIAVTIVSGKDLLKAIEHAPSWWNLDKESKHNALFIIAPTTPEEVMVSVGEAKPEFEQVSQHERIIFWSAPLKTFSRTRWSKIVGSTYYDRITIRNANTVMKLAEIVKKEK